MIQQFDAVYENGILRPSELLHLAEHERVRRVPLAMALHRQCSSNQSERYQPKATANTNLLKTLAPGCHFYESLLLVKSVF